MLLYDGAFQSLRQLKPQARAVSGSRICCEFSSVKLVSSKARLMLGRAIRLRHRRDPQGYTDTVIGGCSCDSVLALSKRRSK